MKLATLDNLTETFVDTLEEDELESELGATEDELGAEDQLADEEGDELAALEDSPPAVDLDPETVETLVSAIADAIGDVTGVDVSVEGGGEELPMDAEGEPAVEDEVEDVEIADVELPEEEPALEEEAPYGGNKGDIPDDDRKKKGHHGSGPKREETAEEEGEINKEGRIPAALVQELTRRVAARLVREAKK
jgi:hypothetical protein